MLVSHEVKHISSITGEERIGKDPYDEGATFANAAESKYLRSRRGKRESAVPAGSQARIFLTWMRLTGGPAFLRERRDKRNWEGQPPGKDRLQALEAALSRAGLNTDSDRVWSGEGIGSRAHTAKRQHTEKARRLFAEANASTHEREARVRREETEQQARVYRYRPTPANREEQPTEASPGEEGGERPNTLHTQTPGASERAGATEPTQAAADEDEALTCMECEEQPEQVDETETDEDWALDMEVQAEVEAAAQASDNHNVR